MENNNLISSAESLRSIQSDVHRIQSLFRELDTAEDIGYYKTLTRVGRGLEILDNVENQIKQLQLKLFYEQDHEQVN
jgi:hypothetical protein